MNTNTTSKYDNITSKSLITSGTPARYQLIPETQDIKSIKRKTFGTKDSSKTNKTILLVGETGAGKSTMVNVLLNHAMGVKFEEDIWFEIVEKVERPQSESQTEDVIVYEIFGFEDQTLPYSLTVIDTPGFGSTSGIEEDVIVSQRLFDLFRSEAISEIDAVGLVMKTSENRLTDRMKYIFDSVVSLFGKDMEENIVILITFSNGVKPKNALKALESAQIKCAKNEKKQPLYFMFDNCQNEDRTEDIDNLQHAERLTMKGLTQFTEFLDKTKPQKLAISVVVLNERIRLTACINNLQQRIEFTDLKRAEIQQTQEALKKYEQKMRENETFTTKVTEAYKEAEHFDGAKWWQVFYKGAVCCTVCKENCHYPGCTIVWSPKHCEVMKDGRCTVCTGKCPVSDHVKDIWRYVNKTREVDQTLQDIKNKYEKNMAEKEKTAGVLQSLHKQLEDLETAKIRFVDEIYQHILNLEQIALNVCSLSTYAHLDFLTEEMDQKKHTEVIQKLKQIKCQMNKGLWKEMETMYCKLSHAFKSK